VIAEMEKTRRKEFKKGFREEDGAGKTAGSNRPH
jgi:hypothetical protein